MSGTLVETSGDRRGTAHAIEKELVIGRGADADIVVKDARASRKHLRVWPEEGAFFVEDLNTTNGSVLNGAPLQGSRRLANGDELFVAGLTLVFRASEETMVFSTRSTAGTGTLTFLFSDLRGFTALVEREGDAAAARHVAEYGALVREAIARARGAEIETEGYSFFVTFPTAGEALRCAIAVQRRARQATTGHPERPIEVGIGLHAGEPETDGKQLIGASVNLAARLCAQAGTGEILVSEVVRGLVRTSMIAPLQERTGLVLKGIDDPPRVYAVDWS